MQISHDEKNLRFIAQVNGGEASLRYQLRDRIMDIVSTFVPHEARGQKVADHLVREALKVAKNSGYQIIPTCSYVARWFDAHPEEKVILAHP